MNIKLSNNESFIVKRSNDDAILTVNNDNYSHAEGVSTIVGATGGHAEGVYNKDEGGIHTIGIGTSDNDRKNAVMIGTTGDFYLYNVGNYDGTNAGSTGVRSLQTVLGTYKTKQDYYSSYSVAVSATIGADSGFIDSITQNANGEIAVTRKYIATTTDLATDVSMGSYPTSQAVVDYVDARIRGAVINRGGFNASDGTVNGTQNTLTDIAEKNGDMYTCIVAGTYCGIEMEIGDSIIFHEDVDAHVAPTANDLTFVEKTVSVIGGTAALAWGSTSTLATVEGVNINAALPAMPNAGDIMGSTGLGSVNEPLYWTGSTFAKTKNFSNYLPLAGGQMTGAGPIAFTPNKIALDFRPNDTTYSSKVQWSTNGNEALVFANSSSAASFIFKTGHDLQNGENWQSTVLGTPSMQIKNQAVAINYALDSGVNPTHTLRVGGSGRFDSDLTVSNNASNTGCTMKYDATEECMKFTF